MESLVCGVCVVLLVRVVWLIRAVWLDWPVWFIRVVAFVRVLWLTSALLPEVQMPIALGSEECEHPIVPRSRS